MKQIAMRVFGISSIVLVMVVGIEFTCSRLLPPGTRYSLLYNTAKNDSDPYGEARGVGFDEIDPMTGWSMSDSLLKSKGFDVDGKSIILHTKADRGKPLLIYLSGGSTTDPAVVSENWPQHLIYLLDSAHINAKIVIGAVGGYNSGQELLKLLEYDYARSADIHISYSGANEVEPTYVSMMEQRFYHTVSHPYYAILPNTMAYIRLKMNYVRLDFKIIDHFAPLYIPYQSNDAKAYSAFVSGFWVRNMETMNSIARAHGHTFLGILQPVQGSSLYTQKNDKPYAEPMITDYKRYYPGLRAACRSDSAFLVDFSSLFDGVKDQVYYDDCHIKKTVYQKMIAQKIYTTLAERHLLNPVTSIAK